jgi:SAM-dependent methyltransferase
MKITHSRQQKIWEEEHKHPFVLLQMDSSEVSSGVTRFIEWLNTHGVNSKLRGIELGCGKGRNVIGLAKLGFDMTGIDFSPAAIKEARKRAKEEGVLNKAYFKVHDATLIWPFKDASFDFVIDCFATTDIESSKGRNFTTKEMKRVLKNGGYLITYLLSPQDEFHKEMMIKSPAEEKNAFLHPTTGKFEKTFDREEILDQYQGLKLIEDERIKKVTEFFGKKYNCYHYWMVFQK